MNKKFFFALTCLLWTGCVSKDPPYTLQVPAHFEQPAIPPDNPLTKEKVALGKRLFFDPILSDDSTVSCATCHIPELAYTDGEKLAVGIMGHMGRRNSPSLVNVVYYPYFFAEGKVPDLETQALAPGLHNDEMGTNLKGLIKKLRKHPYYAKAFKRVFGTEADVKYFVFALASFERTLIGGNSKYDRFLLTGDSSVFTPDEKMGLRLFFSERTQCAQCHKGVLLTDFSFQNIGLYEVYEDEGLARATVEAADSGKFKTPSLRNVAFTAPYMHNGSINTLEEVVEFYNTGGKAHKNKSEWVKPLGLSEDEKKQLVLFLRTLTDEDLLQKKGIYATPRFDHW